MDAYVALDDRVLVVTDLREDPGAREHLVGHDLECLAASSEAPAYVFAGTAESGLQRSTDAGETWEPHPEDARLDNHTLVTHSDAPGRIYTAAGDGYAESEDGGQTWQFPQDGLAHRYVWGLAVDGEDPEQVVVSAAHGARSAHTPDAAEAYVYRRSEGQWERAMDGLPASEGQVRAVLARGTTGNEFAAVTNRGLFLTDDGARSWHPVDIEWPDEYNSQTGRGLAVVES